MQQIKITFLGTSQAIPTETRNHTSILLQYKGDNMLVDCGEGTQRQFRKAKLNMCKVNKLLITHWHGDHVLGIPGFLQSLALNNYSKTLEVYGPLGTKKFMHELMNIFIPVNKIKMNINEVKGTFFENDDFSLEAIQLSHTVPVNGYAFVEKNKLKIKKEKLNSLLKKLNPTKEDFQKLDLLKQGKDIKVKNKILKSQELTESQKGRKVSFIFDTGMCINAKKLAENADLAIIESTYANEEKDLANQYKHLTAAMAAEVAKSGKAKQLILTHISQRHEFKEKNLLHQAKKIFLNTKIAHDLMEVTL